MILARSTLDDPMSGSWNLTIKITQGDISEIYHGCKIVLARDSDFCSFKPHLDKQCTDGTIKIDEKGGVKK